ncbi:unnamed protein product [Rotaria magnacalcarata]|uniref:Uncharacterized protein n=1 Tax=Rotaria magnacalcarata TaxID=392030 RepID=A0A816TEU8_9BILA|nr:unnamed protein product [Rotaria magnacalcarata]
MECNKIMLTPATLIEAKDDLKSFAIDIPQILKMGILKSYDDTAIGTQNQTEKQYYFVHLSFQEHFAARHLLSILMSTDKVKAINFISNNKYNQRFHFVFVFASGLLAQSHYKSCIEPFWSTVQAALSDTDTDARAAACATLGNFGEKAATNEVIAALINATRNEDYYVRSKACEALGKLGEKAATDEVVAALINATRDKAYNVTWKAWKALRELGEKAVTNEMIAGLVNEHSGRIDYDHNMSLGLNIVPHFLLQDRIPCLSLHKIVLSYKNHQLKTNNFLEEEIDEFEDNKKPTKNI